MCLSILIGFIGFKEGSGLSFFCFITFMFGLRKLLNVTGPVILGNLENKKAQFEVLFWFKCRLPSSRKEVLFIVLVLRTVKRFRCVLFCFVWTRGLSTQICGFPFPRLKNSCLIVKKTTAIVCRVYKLKGFAVKLVKFHSRLSF